MRRTLAFGIYFALLLGCAIGSGAQTLTSAVHGTVTDPSGAIIPSATVVLTNDSGGSKTASTGKDGGFAFDRLPPGRYSVSVTAPGFAPASVPDIMVFAGKSTAANVTLELPVEHQQVQVTAQGLSVDANPDNNASATFKARIWKRSPTIRMNCSSESAGSRRSFGGPQRRPDLHRRLQRRPASAEIFHPRDPHQPEPLFRAVRQARLRPHRDPH